MGGLVSSVGDLFGGAQNNAGFTATGANIAQPTSIAQANNAYNQAQFGLGQQQNLIQALGAQNGIQNQSNVVNQLQGVANGTGPNPALAQLNQTTGQNVANQAALMAGQRGASANPALLARQAAQQGAATQQQAVGQGATLAAQQQLGALGQLGGLTTQQVGQYQNAIGGLNSGAQNEQQQILGGINAQNQANVSSTSNVNNANAALAQTNANNTAGALGSLSKGLSGGLITLAKGGEVPNPKIGAVSGAHRYPAHLQQMATLYHPEHLQSFSKVQNYDSGGDVGNPYAIHNVALDRANSDSDKSDPSTSKTNTMQNFQNSPIGKLGSSIGSLFAKDGGKIPGKAEMKGDHKTNDTVPAMLSPGEFVIPKSVMESEDPAAGAAKMIAEYQKKNGNQHKMQGDFKSALQRAIKERKSK